MHERTSRAAADWLRLARGVARRGRTQAGELAEAFEGGHGAAHRVGRHRVADEVALRLRAAEVTEDLQLVDAFDTSATMSRPSERPIATIVRTRERSLGCRRHRARMPGRS